MVLGISEVRERVEKALEEDERTADYAIEIIDQDGMVTLKGVVDSAEAKEAAEKIASEQEGVFSVVNALVVAGEGEDEEDIHLIPVDLDEEEEVEGEEDDDETIVAPPATSTKTTGTPPSGPTPIA